MMLITEVHSVFKERLNRLSSNYHEDLSPYQIDSHLNDGVYRLLERASRNEASRKFGNLFASVIQRQSVTPVAVGDTEYSVQLDSLEYPFFDVKRIMATTNCGKSKVIIEGHGRINDLLTDAFQRPSKKWRRLLATLDEGAASNSRQLTIYSEAGFTITSLDITYVRYPKPVFFGGYDSPSFVQCQASGGTDCNQYDNTSTVARTFDIHANYHSLMIDFAVEETLRSLGLGNEYQLRQMKTAEFVNQ